MHFSVHSSTIYNSQDIAATQTFINRQVGKEDVVYIFNGILFTHEKNEIMPFAPISRDYHTKWSCCSVTKSCLILCDPMNCSMPGFSVYHYLPEFSQTHVHWASDTIQPSHSLLLPSLLALNFFSSIRVFSSESYVCLQWSKYWNFSFSISPFKEYSGLISFRIDWFNPLAIQGTLKSLLQHHTVKVLIL